jgi:16S rRNA (guanine527-N7)-methyltransferase
MAGQKASNAEFDAKLFSKRLMETLEGLFISPPLPRDRLDKLVAFGTRLAQASRQINLTRILDPEDMAIRHFLDTYQLLNALKGVQGLVLDAGCGGGIPGIPLAIFRQNLPVAMIDGTAKKIRLVVQWIKELGLSNAMASHARAEEHLKNHSYAAVITRAAIKPLKMMEILSATGPVVNHVIFMEGAQGKAKVREMLEPASKAGYVFDLAFPYRLPGLNKDRYLLRFKRANHPPRRR